MSNTRTALHRIAAHVMSRARHAASGKIGLRATPAGFGTPAFGDAIEVLRIAGTTLVRERDGRAAYTSITGRSLRELATFVDVSLDEPFNAAGPDAPDAGDVDEPVTIDEHECAIVADWFDLGWRVIDAVTAPHHDATALQLWPEHFDAGTSVAIGPADDDRCNLGASPGDSFSAEPYLYVGPWSDPRPGDASYWNAPFGAVLTRAALLAERDPHRAAVAFLERGLELVKSRHAH